MCRLRRPSFASHRIAVENGPDRSAAIVAVVDPRQRRIEEIIGVPFEVPGIAPAALNIGIERIVVVGDVLAAGLVVEAPAEHVDQNDVLPIGDPEPGGAGAVEYRTAWHP